MLGRNQKPVETFIDTALETDGAALWSYPFLNHQTPAIEEMLGDDLEAWMDKRGFGTIDDFRGTLSQRNVPDPSAFERAQYVQLILSQN